jgi:hypothetical protein
MTYEATTEGISIIDGVEVDITVRGTEDKAEKTLMALKERCGIIAAAYDKQTPPSEFDRTPVEYMPMMKVDWEGVFEE